MEQMTKPAKPWLWKSGQSGNPQGRPPGARSQFSEAFLRDLRDGWQKHGKEVIDKVAKLEPTAFFATAARIIPKDVEISIAQQYPARLDGVKRTWAGANPMSAFDPKRTFGPEDCCHAK